MRWRLSSLARRLGHQGQVFITVAVSSLALTGFVALATNIGYYMHERQQLQHALDAGALAGAQFLPGDGEQARLTALEFVTDNDALDASNVNITFGCLVSPEEDDPSRADSADVRGLCPQYKDDLLSFNCPGNGGCYRLCTFRGDTDGCNTIRVQTNKTVNFLLSNVVSDITSLDANLEGVACRGGCGPPPDITMVFGLDNSPSMGHLGKLERAKEGATSILTTENLLVKEIHQVAWATTHDPFFQGPFTDDYTSVASALNDLETELGTNFAGLLSESIDNLVQRFPGLTTKKQIILLTDGHPTLPSPGKPCADAQDQAERAKAEDVRIFVIHYNDNELFCPDIPSLEAKDFLAGLAKDSAADFDNCDDENADFDDYFCKPDGEDLREVFRIIVKTILNELGAGSSLVDLSGFN
ncbi:vWA domain-containing protein [Candidatus Entotheonella palauensis]|uniref:vWA domain-containing protein n=1 Tax=Candidatus Entotheonella palauensis TaxID=93172 RepID=UPI0004AE8678|nr:vWA domain-containing protein [Candidatus Entotheonella palauensis]